MYGFVYIWYDRKHKRYYIGSHKGSFEDGYICSSSWMKRAYKRRPYDFKRKILKVIKSKSDLLNEEQKWLDLIKNQELGKKYYNLKKKAAGGFSRCAIQKSIDYRKNKPLSDSHKQKQSQALKNKEWSENRRKAQSGNYKRKLTYEHDGVIIGTIEQTIAYANKSKATINRWCDNPNKKEWRKYYVT